MKERKNSLLTRTESRAFRLILPLFLAATLWMAADTQPAYAQDPCDGCVSTSSGSREMGYPPCVRWTQGGGYDTCANDCCICWITTVAGLDETSKQILREWEREVWQQTPGLDKLSDTYRDYGSWGQRIAQAIDAVGLEDEARAFLEFVASTVQPGLTTAD